MRPLGSWENIGDLSCHVEAGARRGPSLPHRRHSRQTVRPQPPHVMVSFASQSAQGKRCNILADCPYGNVGRRRYHRGASNWCRPTVLINIDLSGWPRCDKCSVPFRPDGLRRCYQCRPFTAAADTSFSPDIADRILSLVFPDGLR